MRPALMMCFAALGMALAGCDVAIQAGIPDGSGGGGGGGGDAGAGDGGSPCGSWACELNGNCIQSVPKRIGAACGVGTCTTCTITQHCVADTCTAFKRLFATRTQYDGNLGGAAGADAKCALAASAAGLPGVFKAWISDGTTDSISRIGPGGPWFSALRSSFDGSMSTTLMFNNKANLQTLPLDNYLSWADETGASFEGEIWTGTATGGTRLAETCGNWSGTGGMGGVGRLGGTSGASVWTSYQTRACSTQAALLCIEQ